MSTTFYGPRVAQVRKSLGLTVRELAAKMGISRGYLGDIESGRCAPSRRVIQALTDKINVNYDFIINGKGDMFQRQVKEPAPKYDHNKDLAIIKAWLDDFWSSASEQERSWLTVHMQYTFPQFRDYLKGGDNV